MIPLTWNKGEELYIAAHAEVVKVEEVITDNLVENGDFEYPDVPDGEWNIFNSSEVGWGIEWYGGSETFDGYNRPEPKLEIHDAVVLNGVTAYSGDQYAELDTDWDGPGGGLNGEPASVKIYQNLMVDYGGYEDYLPPYTCDLNYAWRPRTGDSQMEVYWGGNLIASHADSGYEWHPEEISDLTLDGSAELAFIEIGTPDSLGMFLDAVSVVCSGYEVVQEETAWAGEEEFLGKNWATYFTYTVQ